MCHMVWCGSCAHAELRIGTRLWSSKSAQHGRTNPFLDTFWLWRCDPAAASAVMSCVVTTKWALTWTSPTWHASDCSVSNAMAEQCVQQSSLSHSTSDGRKGRSQNNQFLWMTLDVLNGWFLSSSLSTLDIEIPLNMDICLTVCWCCLSQDESQYNSFPPLAPGDSLFVAVWTLLP